ncbi:MAG: hypothetical protein AB9842_01440 [Bacteroidales bacterium]
MIRVLILAYDFTPLASAGAQRPYSWFRYLKDYQVYPVIVTRHWDDVSVDARSFVKASESEETIIDVSEPGTIIRTPYFPNFRDKLILKYGENKWKLLRKILSFILSVLKFYFIKFDNTIRIFHAADSYLKSNKCDFIIATGEPFVLFKHAFILSRKHNIPYVLDYRDGWTDSIDLTVNQKKFRLLNKLLFRHLEKKYLKGAAFITVASSSYINRLKNIYNNKFFEILNGYFEEDYLDLKIKKNSQFTVTYSGKIYQFQPLEEFLEVLNKMSEYFPGQKIKINFIGGVNDEVLIRRIKKYLLQSELEIVLLPRLNYKKYAGFICASDLLLLLSDDTGGWLNAKLFDYLAARKNIVLFKSDNNIMHQIISDCYAGYICNDTNELFYRLKLLFSEYSKDGSLTCNSRGFEKYKRSVQVEKLAKLLIQCVE